MSVKLRITGGTPVVTLPGPRSWEQIRDDWKAAQRELAQEHEQFYAGLRDHGAAELLARSRSHRRRYWREVLAHTDPEWWLARADWNPITCDWRFGPSEQDASRYQPWRFACGACGRVVQITPATRPLWRRRVCRRCLPAAVVAAARAERSAA